MPKEKRNYIDRRKYLIEAVKKRRIKVRNLARELKGSKCEICGYAKCQEALEFHHIHEKKFGISEKGYTRSWQKVKNELDKCQLVCANCHREIHSKLAKKSKSK
ncbi:MAG: HNH endonuclease signature motif containing protein [Patescibacteria group bacterium]|jgi:hypothetical protein